MVLFISVHFPPRLLEDLGQGPALDDKLQIIVIIKRKKNERMRTQEPREWGPEAGASINRKFMEEKGETRRWIASHWDPPAFAACTMCAEHLSGRKRENC